MKEIEKNLNTPWWVKSFPLGRGYIQKAVEKQEDNIQVSSSQERLNRKNDIWEFICLVNGE